MTMIEAKISAMREAEKTAYKWHKAAQTADKDAMLYHANMRIECLRAALALDQLVTFLSPGTSFAVYGDRCSSV